MRRIATRVGLGLLLLTAGGRAVDDDPGDVQAQLDHHLPEVRFRANAFSEVIDFMRDVTGANLWVQPGALAKAGITPETPVTYETRDKKMSAVLAGVLDAAGGHGKATFGLVGNVIAITTPADLKQLQATAARHNAAKEPAAIADRKVPEVSFNANHLSAVLDGLQDMGGVRIHPDWNALVAAGVGRDAPVAVSLSGAPMSDVLTLVLASVGDGGHRLDYRVEPDGTVTVSTTQSLSAAQNSKR
jgi:hypothetical protein